MGKGALFIQRMIKKINIGYEWGILTKINKRQKNIFRLNQQREWEIMKDE